MLRALLLAAALVAASAAEAEPNSVDVLTAARKAVPAGAEVVRYGPDALNHGELRAPDGKGPFPVVVLIHGGCWLAAMDDMTGLNPLAVALNQRGFATWNFEYRRIGNPGGGWPGTFQDVASGIDHLRILARGKPLDLSRVTFVGHSSGAHLALWAASRPRLKDPVAGADPLKAGAVVAIDGPGDLAPFVGVDAEVCGQPVITALMGGTPQERPGAYAAASPAAHLPLGVSQGLVYGDLKPFMTSYADAAKAAGDPVEVQDSPGSDHFNIITPGTSQGDATVNFIVREASRRR